MILDESSQVDSSSGGSLVLIKPQDVVAGDTNRIGSNLCSAQTVETNSGVCETEGKTLPATMIEQNKSNRFVLPAANDGTDDKDVDEPSQMFQETLYPLLGVVLANSNSSVTISQQKAENKDNLPIGHQSLSQEDSMNQDEKDVHSIDQHKHLQLAHDVPPVDTDTQTINQDNDPVDQDKESINQEQQSLDQDHEDNDNPFSHLLLFSDNDNTDDKPLRASKKKQWHKAKPKPPVGGRGKKTERVTPDSFVAVRFSSPELKHKLEVVQQHMTEMDKKLKPALIPLVKLHITLMTLRLSNDTSLIEK